MRRRGISLLELLLTVALLAIMMSAVTTAFVNGLSAESKISTARESKDEQMRFEDDLQSLIVGAEISDPNGVFESPIPSSNQPSSSSSNGADGSSSGNGLPAGSSSLVFTSWSVAPKQGYLEQTNGAQWEDLNAQYGPQGGSTLVALSTFPVGDAGTKQGLFLREDRPPQSDPTSGGTERLYSAKVKDIRFEFYDGTNWQTTWDSKNGQKGKLPLSVRVTYVFLNEQNTHSFTARLQNSTGGTSSS